MSHTPTPWRRGQEGNQRIYGPDGSGEDSGLICSAVRGRDIDFIVKACNAHDELVAGLHRVHNALMTPSTPRQAVGEMVAYLLTKVGEL